MNKLYNATDFERAPADFYPTPPDLTRGLIDGLAQAAIALPGPILEPCCGAGVLANVLTTESGLKVVGSDLYPERYTEAAALYATTSPVDARDPGSLLKVIEMTGVAALVTNPPYGRDHHRIAEAFLRLLHSGFIRFAALLVPHQFDAAGRRGHLFQDPLPRVAGRSPRHGGSGLRSRGRAHCQAPCGSRGGRVRAPEADSNRACLSAFGANGRAEPSIPSENSDYPLA